MTRYWFTFKTPLRVTYHLLADLSTAWRGIYGVTIGDWFIGVIHGSNATANDDKSHV